MSRTYSIGFLENVHQYFTSKYSEILKLTSTCANWSSSVRYIVVLNIWKKTFATHSSFIHLEQIALEKDSCGLEKNIVNVGRRWRTFSA